MLKLLKEKYQQRKTRQFYSQFIHQNSLCFDIGANIGERTAVFAKLGAKVVALEPVKSTFDILASRFEGHTAVTLLPFAVSNQVGESKIHVASHSAVSSMSMDFIAAYSNQKDHPISWSTTQKVQLTTINQLIAEYGVPDFCKIDIEGHELAALQGLSQSLPALSFEYNARLKENTLHCLQYLSRFGQLAYNFSAYESMQWYTPQWMDYPAVIQFLEQLPANVLTGDFYACTKKTL